MNMPNISFGLLAATILLWIGLTMWRQAGSELMQRIERSYLEHYRSHAGEPGESPPLVRWDFEQDTLVVTPPDEVQEIEGTGGLTVGVVKKTNQRVPLFAYGIRVARIPASWFHGAFAAASLVLAFFAFGTRAQ